MFSLFRKEGSLQQHSQSEPLADSKDSASESPAVFAGTREASDPSARMVDPASHYVTQSMPPAPAPADAGAGEPGSEAWVEEEQPPTAGVGSLAEEPLDSTNSWLDDSPAHLRAGKGLRSRGKRLARPVPLAEKKRSLTENGKS